MARSIQAKPIIAVNLNNQPLNVVTKHSETLGSIECSFKILSEKALTSQMFIDPTFLKKYARHLSPDVKELLTYIIFDIIKKG